MPFGQVTLRTVGDRVKWLRLERGLTQTELAKMAHITQPTLSAIERGETKQSFAPTVIALAGALQANIRWLQTGKGDPFSLGDSDKNELHEMIGHLSEEQTALVKALVRSVIASTTK